MNIKEMELAVEEYLNREWFGIEGFDITSDGRFYSINIYGDRDSIKDQFRYNGFGRKFWESSDLPEHSGLFSFAIKGRPLRWRVKSILKRIYRLAFTQAPC